MPKDRARPEAKQKCYCAECKGASLSWTTWARHRKSLNRAVTVLTAEAQGVDPPVELDPSTQQDDDLRARFSRMRSKHEQKLEQNRTRVLAIREEIVRLQTHSNYIPGSLRFVETPVDMGSNGE